MHKGGKKEGSRGYHEDSIVCKGAHILGVIHEERASTERISRQSVLPISLVLCCLSRPLFLYRNEKSRALLYATKSSISPQRIHVYRTYMYFMKDRWTERRERERGRGRESRGRAPPSPPPPRYFHSRIITGNKSPLHKCNERYVIATHTTLRAMGARAKRILNRS